jgi:hypothetical protein
MSNELLLPENTRCEERALESLSRQLDSTTLLQLIVVSLLPTFLKKSIIHQCAKRWGAYERSVVDPKLFFSDSELDPTIPIVSDPDPLSDIFNFVSLPCKCARLHILAHFHLIL